MSQKWIKMDKKEKLKMKLIELAKSGNLDLEQFPESIRQKISQIRQNEGTIFNLNQFLSKPNWNEISNWGFLIPP